MRELATAEQKEIVGGDFSWTSFAGGLACGAAMVAGAGTGVGILVAVSVCSVALSAEAK